MMMHTRVSKTHTHAEINTPLAFKTGAGSIELRVKIPEILAYATGSPEERA